MKTTVFARHRKAVTLLLLFSFFVVTLSPFSSLLRPVLAVPVAAVANGAPAEAF